MLKKQVTEKEIQSRISDEEIFNRYFGEFELGKAYSSVFRTDRNPSTAFYVTATGHINYKDFATGENLAPVNFVMRLYDIPYGKALDLISKDFGLRQGDKPLVKRIDKKFKPHVVRKFDVSVGLWDEKSLAYWKRYYITQEELEKNNVFRVTRLVIEKDGRRVLVPMEEDKPKFAYLIRSLDGKQYTKIYSPFDDKFRWLSNCPDTIPFGLYELPFKTNTLIITKSKKEEILWKKYLPDVIGAQHEAFNVITADTAQFLNNEYDYICVLFDSDHYYDVRKQREVYIGREASKQLCDTYGWKMLDFPDIYFDKYGIKDIGDLVEKRGLESFEKFLKLNKLWNG
jgi:hypothetical protein